MFIDIYAYVCTYMRTLILFVMTKFFDEQTHTCMHMYVLLRMYVRISFQANSLCLMSYVYIVYTCMHLHMWICRPNLPGGLLLYLMTAVSVVCYVHF